VRKAGVRLLLENEEHCSQHQNTLLVNFASGLNQKQTCENMKSCAARKEYFDGTSVKQDRFSAVKRGTALVSNAVMSSSHLNTDLHAQ